MPDTTYNRARERYKLKEYMAAGLPVVASPVRHVSRLVRHGATGYLARTGSEWVESLRALIDDAALRTRLSQGGRRLVEERYTTERDSRELADLVRRELRRKRDDRV